MILLKVGNGKERLIVMKYRKMAEFNFKMDDILFTYDMPQKRTISVNKTERFHRQKQKIPVTILSKMDSHEVIYGARALNKRFPSFLDRHTQDYDIYTPHPERDARETERALDRRFGGDFFFVARAQCPRTWRVKSHVNDEVYADYTRPEEKIPFDVIDKHKYVTLSHTKKHILKTLDDPSASYRFPKDRDALNRIKIFERLKK